MSQPSVASARPFLAATPAGPSAGTAARFTLDGDATLEARLEALCGRVRAGIAAIVPARHLEAILLGGGYGRGEGGVRRTPGGDQPYNDLEFYVFLRGSVLLNERRYLGGLLALAHELTASAGLEVEFKIAAAERLRRDGVTMFSYDLVKGHRRLCGPENLLRGCEHHERAADIPLAEATRLLMNRCSGLLFARHRLPGPGADIDFIGRNIAKARLALGDAVLAAFGQYHWSCRERQRRLAGLAAAERLPFLQAIRAEHARGVAFKLHPDDAGGDATALHQEHAVVTQLAQRVWLWLEKRRLGTDFSSPVEYALHPADKCPETSALRNCLVTVRRFGPTALFASAAFRYPRERLLRALPVLLWQPAILAQRPVLLRLQGELRTAATDEPGLLDAYNKLWEVFR